MTSVTSERAFEDLIADALVARGWRLGDPATYDAARGLFPPDFLGYVRENQPELWSSLAGLHGDGLGPKLLDHLRNALADRGTPDVLRRGFDFFGHAIEVAAFPPSHGRNEALLASVARGRLTVTRQVRFDAAASDSVDLVLSLNGVPVATAELKSRLAGAHGHVDAAIEQYQKRPTGVPLFRFKSGPVVHFAVDSEEAWMTTRLDGPSTRFVPFNRGCDGGKGNPQHPSGHRTAYLWEEVWERGSFLDVLGRFAQYVEIPRRRDGRLVPEPAMVFPRYHQLDAVRRLVAAARAEGPGRNYLVQHSAGSGKSNTIAWLALRLAGLHDAADRRVFDAVLVVTDRRVLDQQIEDTIAHFDHERSLVKPVDGAKMLRAELEKRRTRVLIVTVQTFPFVAGDLDAMAGRRFAVIIDEAHSSQRGVSAEAMHRLLGTAPPATSGGHGAEPDVEDFAAAWARSRRHANQSVFAFTATPRDETVVAFRHAPGEEGAFHTYTMRQSLEEGFILDVLRRYVTFDSYFRLLQTSPDDPRVPRRRAAAALARLISRDRKSREAKTAIVVDHFLTHVRDQLGGRAKAMVVAPSREAAVAWWKDLRAALAERDDAAGVGVLVAFTGEVPDPDTKRPCTEAGLNGFPEDQLPGEFEKDSWRLLVVANKYQTGFDQPKLQAMYVDRALRGIQAVQTLSRLNRTHPGKDDPFVLDFVNDPDEVRAAFARHYGSAPAVRDPDPEELARLRDRLDASGVYTWEDVRAWAHAAWVERAKAGDLQARLLAALAPAVDNYRALSEDDRAAFRADMTAYVDLYGLLGQVLDVNDPDGEMLHGFGRSLLAVATEGPSRAPLPDLARHVTVVAYALRKAHDGPLALGGVADGDGAPDGGAGAGVSARTPRPVDDPTAKLSEVLASLHARFGLPDDPAMAAAAEDALAAVGGDDAVRESAGANDEDNFVFGNQKRMRRELRQRVDSDAELAERFPRSGEAMDELVRGLLKALYARLRAAESASPPPPGQLGAAGRVQLLRLNYERNGVEPKLRRLVRQVLADALGPAEWIRPVLAAVPSEKRRALEALDPDEVLAKHLLLSNVIAAIDANWGHFANVLERGRPQGSQVRREHLKVLLDFVNEHREDAHARPISDTELEAVERVVERVNAVLDGVLRA